MLQQVAKPLELNLAAHISPADASTPILEPQEIEEFLLLMQLTFMPNPHTCRMEIDKFAAISSESIKDLSDRFDNIAFPILHSGLRTTRELAILLHRHLPIHIRAGTIAAMHLEDERRTKTGEALINLGELLQLARSKEDHLLRFEKEIREVGQWPDDRPTEETIINANPPTLTQEEATTRRASPRLKDKLGPCCTTVHRQHQQAPASSNDTSKERRFHRYSDNKIVERASINETSKPRGGLDLRNHKTENHKCFACAKMGVRTTSSSH